MKPDSAKPRKKGFPARFTKAELKARDLARCNAVTLVAQDIGKIPAVKDPERWARCGASFSMFCTTYFPRVFYFAWSKDLLRVVRKVQEVVLENQSLAVAMPRGSGKTSLCRAALLWAILYGYHRYVMLIAAIARKSSDSMGVLKTALEKNDLLMEDFPEVCYPIRKLDNEPRKQRGQRYLGEHTNIKWELSRIVLPTIPGSPSSGSIIDTTSMEGDIRGGNLSLPDGSSVRPSLVMCDDPQTPEVARSQGPGGQTEHRLQTIVQDVQGLAGPGSTTAILVPCTVIKHGDVADRLLQRPDFRGERTKRLYSWSTNTAMWDQYRELRDQAMREGSPLSDVTAFYKARMCSQGRGLDDSAEKCGDCPARATCMDCGAQVDWAERFDVKHGEVSSLQNAMHDFYKYGPDGFAAEFQNEPLTGDEGTGVLSAAVCASRFNGRARLEVPLECTEITMGVDVQQSSLWWVLAAWAADFTGVILDYGVWPPQSRRSYTLREIVDSQQNLQTMYPGRGIEGTIQAGLEEFVGRALATNYTKVGGGGLMRIGRLLVDSGKWPGVIAAVKRKVGGATMMLSRGVGIKAGGKPMSSSSSTAFSPRRVAAASSRCRPLPWTWITPPSKWPMMRSAGSRPHCSK